MPKANLKPKAEILARQILFEVYVVHLNMLAMIPCGNVVVEPQVASRHCLCESNLAILVSASSLRTHH